MRMFAFVVLAVVLSTRSATAAYCPFCEAPSLTLAEQIDQSAHLLLAQWVSGEKPTNESAGVSRFRILEVAKTKGDAFKPFDPAAADANLLELPQYIAGKKDGLYVLVGPGDRLIDWHIPSAATEDSWKYLKELPAPVTEEKAQIERLAYFLDYLEHPEIKVANDAYAEFAAAPYEIIKALANRMPREKIRKWVVSPDTPVTRMGLYGLLLGLSGNDEDAEVMKQKILMPESDFRLGIEGVMSGYILLKGEPGLRVLEETKMHANTYINEEGEEVKLPFSETYAAMQTLRFLWAYEPDRISKDRLRVSMRYLLERPDLADIAIADLSRWKDWTLHDRLMEMYDDEEFNIPSVKRAIVRYFHYCSKDGEKVTQVGTGESPEGSGDENSTAESSELPTYAVAAAEHLKTLEEKDPKTCRTVLRFLRNR